MRNKQMVAVSFVTDVMCHVSCLMCQHVSFVTSVTYCSKISLPSFHSEILLFKIKMTVSIFIGCELLHVSIQNAL